jgi:hypothetical protein
MRENKGQRGTNSIKKVNLKMNKTQMNEQNCEQNLLHQTSTYDVKGRQFIVEPKFDDNAAESFGSILLKLVIGKN